MFFSKALKKSILTKGGLEKSGLFGVRRKRTSKASRNRTNPVFKATNEKTSSVGLSEKSQARVDEINKYLDDGDSDGAYAAIQRHQWNNFEENDKPYILNYANEITGDKYIDRAVDQAADGMSNGFAIEANNQERRNESLGLSMSNRVQANNESDTKRANAAALVDAQNSAQTAAVDRQSALIAGTSMPEKVGG